MWLYYLSWRFRWRSSYENRQRCEVNVPFLDGVAQQTRGNFMSGWYFHVLYKAAAAAAVMSVPGDQHACNMILFIYSHQFSALTSWRTSKHPSYVFYSALMMGGGGWLHVFCSSPTFSHGDVGLVSVRILWLQAKPPHEVMEQLQPPEVQQHQLSGAEWIHVLLRGCVPCWSPEKRKGQKQEIYWKLRGHLELPHRQHLVGGGRLQGGKGRAKHRGWAGCPPPRVIGASHGDRADNLRLTSPPPPPWSSGYS